MNHLEIEICYLTEKTHLGLDNTLQASEETPVIAICQKVIDNKNMDVASEYEIILILLNTGSKVIKLNKVYGRDLLYDFVNNSFSNIAEKNNHDIKFSEVINSENNTKELYIRIKSGDLTRIYAINNEGKLRAIGSIKNQEAISKIIKEKTQTCNSSEDNERPLLTNEEALHWLQGISIKKNLCDESPDADNITDNTIEEQVRPPILPYYDCVLPYGEEGLTQQEILNLYKKAGNDNNSQTAVPPTTSNNQSLSVIPEESEKTGEDKPQLTTKNENNSTTDNAPGTNEFLEEQPREDLKKGPDGQPPQVIPGKNVKIITTVSSFVLAVAATAWLVFASEFQYNKSATNIIAATVLLGVGAVGAILGSLSCSSCLSDARSQAKSDVELTSVKK